MFANIIEFVFRSNDERLMVIEFSKRFRKHRHVWTNCCGLSIEWLDILKPYFYHSKHDHINCYTFVVSAYATSLITIIYTHIIDAIKLTKVVGHLKIIIFRK